VGFVEKTTEMGFMESQGIDINLFLPKIGEISFDDSERSNFENSLSFIPKSPPSLLRIKEERLEISSTK